MSHANNTSAASASLSETDFEMVQLVIDDIPYGPQLEESRLSECSIYKVPSNLLKVNEEAYTPQCISIGPMHYLHKEEFMPMQEHKKRYFDFFRKRVSNEQAMRAYKHYIETHGEEIQQRYADQNFLFNICKEKFVDMMLLDAVFIMELFLRHCEAKSYGSKQTKYFRLNDDVLIHSWLSRNITRDLILLENQIPFFLLEVLYERVVPSDDKMEEHTAGFVDLAIDYFAVLHVYDTQMSSFNETQKHYFSGPLRTCFKSKRNYRFPALNGNPGSANEYGRPKHFIDLIRLIYLPIDFEPKRDRAHHVLRTATKLQDSGVSFEKGDVKRRLTEITFDKTPILSLLLCFGFLKPFKARLSIPPLKVDHTTECLFLNLIALEQCCYPAKPYICNYVSLIDSLIHTQLDVELLVENEVIVHELGSDKEVATLVNGFCQHVVTNSTCYHETINDLNDHYMSNWNHTMATLRLVYFKDLWRASGTVVGIFVLLFAVFQFLAAVRDTFKN